MADELIGTREYGKRAIGERWYQCAITGRVVPESETVVPTWPHPHAGQRIWLGAFDEPDYEMNRLLDPPRTYPDEEGP